MTNDPKLLKQTLRYFKEENAELIKREARLERGIKEQENAINDLREQVFHLTKDQLRLEWLLAKAYSIQLREGDILTCRAAIDIAMEEELKQLK
jgi:hypothetical protein